MSWHCWKPTGWKRSTESGTTSVYRTVFLFHGRPHMTLMPGQTVGFPYHVCRTMRHVHGQSTNAVVHHCRTISYKTIHIVFQFLPAKVAFCLRLGKALLRTGWKEKSSSLRSGIFSFQALRNHGKKQTGAYKK